MLASNPSVNGFPDRMNGLDFFFSPSATVDASTGNSAEDDDWGEFVDSSDAIARLDSLSPNPNGADSAPNRIGSDKKSQAQWVTSRGPVPLSVFGEEEEDAEGDESGAPVSSFGFSFDSFSRKHNDGTRSVNGVVNTNPTVGINGLIANLYRENGQNELTNGRNLPENNRGHLETNGNNSHMSTSRGFDLDLSSSANIHVNPHLGLNDKESLSSRKTENSAVSLDTLNWNPLNLDTERSERTINVVNSNSDLGFADKNDEDDDDGWEFKAAESMFQTANGGFKEEQENAKSASVVVQNTTILSSSVWNSPTNGTGPNFDSGKIDAVKPGFDRENGDDDPWANGGWEFKVAEAGEPKNDLTNKESNGWGFGFGFEPVSKIETTSSFQSNFEKEPQKRENGSISFPSNANVNSEGASWAFNQPSLETENSKEEKEVQTDKPKGALPLSFFEDEEFGTSDSSVHEDNLVSVCDFSMREKTKAPNQTVSINDLISSLYSQIEEKTAVNSPVKAATDSNLVNDEDDSWEFQGPTKTITDSSIAEDTDDFDGTWEFQGPLRALKNSDVAEGVDEFDDDSWEFQGPTQPVKDSTLRKGDNGSWESKNSSVENEVGNQFSVPDGFGELHEKPVISIERNDYQDIFHKLKTELYYIAQNHLETLKDARDLAADSLDKVAEVQKYDSDIEDLQNLLNNDVLSNGVNLESLQPRFSGVTELSKVLQEPKFQALDSEDLLSERLLLVQVPSALLWAEKDWKSTIELVKHATLTLKILNLGSPEQQSKYASTWFVIASACAQELRHAASIWKQVIENDVQEEILSKPQGKSYALSVGEIYRVVKILRASTRLYRPWILLAPASTNVLPVLDECVKLWLSSGLQEALNRDNSADQLVKSIKYIEEVDAFTLHTCITSATSPTCYISGLNTEIIPGIKTVEWNGEHYLLPIANLWANLISRDSPSLTGHCFPTVS